MRIPMFGVQRTRWQRSGLLQFTNYAYKSTATPIKTLAYGTNDNVQYTYNQPGAWGNVLRITGSAANTIGVNNPLRYRGYIYDPETQLYYCQSRYYNPETGRFINADAFASTGQGLLGNNMFAYCNNNPVNFSDYFGFKPAGLDYKPAYYGEDQIFVDLTEKLNEFMKSNAQKLTEYIDEHGYIAAMFYFYTNVNDGRELDIKLQDDWKFEEGTTYVYSGMILRHDDPGNINFGYIGAIIFPEEILCFGAGVNQISKYGFSYGSIATYYDDPRDNAMIRLGVWLYKENMI